jgi:hypothetical protein
MTFAPPDGPLPELSTTRVAGGTSARLVAAAVAGLLIGVVGYAFVNRPPAPTPLPVAAAPSGAPSASTSTPTPSPPRNQILGNDGIFGWPVVAQLGQQRAPREYRYEVSMTIVGGLVRVPLEPSSLLEVHNGTVFVGTADVGSTLTLEISRNWTQGGLLIFEPFDAWTIGLKPLRKSRAGLVDLLVAHVPPASAGPNGPEPVANGYTFTVLGRREPAKLTLYFELVWPLATQPTQAIAFAGPRHPALYNRCRWDIGPLSAPPRPGTNEADC